MTWKKTSEKWVIPRNMLLQVLIPTLISSAALSLSNIADAVTVGQRLGEKALAAIGIVTPIYLFYNVIALSFGIGGSIVHAQLCARRKELLTPALFRKIAFWTGGISLFLILAGNLFPDFLLRLLAASEEDPELWTMCRQYARPLLTASPILLFSYMLYYFVQNDDDPRRAAQAMTAGGILDVVLNILFVLVAGWGVRGAALATITAQAVSLGILTVHFFSAKGTLHFRVIFGVKDDRPQETRRYFRISFRTGFASSIGYVFQFCSQLLMNHLLMWAGARELIPGTLYVAVYDLILNISYLAMPVYSAIGDAMQPAVATFSAERDQESLHMVEKMSLQLGIALGTLVAAVLAIQARPAALFFGFREETQLAVAVPAIRIFLISAPLTGILSILLRYCQARRETWYTFIATALREAVCLIPFTLFFGLRDPARIWWVFPLTAALSLLIFQLFLWTRKMKDAFKNVRACRIVMTNNNRELATALAQVEEFCDENRIPPGKAAQIQLGVEELCAVTMQKAFTGRKDEYIQIVLVIEPGPQYVLHIRDSAPFFNPLDLRMEKARKDMEASIMDSIGVMMVRRQSKFIDYRHYQGFNTMTVVYE